MDALLTGRYAATMIAASADRAVAVVATTIDLAGVGGLLAGIAAFSGVLIVPLTTRRSREAAAAGRAAAGDRRQVAETQAATVEMLHEQLSVMRNLVASCPVPHCPIRSTIGDHHHDAVL